MGEIYIFPVFNAVVDRTAKGIRARFVYDEQLVREIIEMMLKI